MFHISHGYNSITFNHVQSIGILRTLIFPKSKPFCIENMAKLMAICIYNWMFETFFAFCISILCSLTYIVMHISPLYEGAGNAIPMINAIHHGWMIKCCIFCMSYRIHSFRSLPNHPDVIAIQSTNGKSIPNTYFHLIFFLYLFCSR